MKKLISTLEDALAFELQSLYDGERRLKDKINSISPAIEQETLNAVLKKYAESADHKRLKIDRMFSYLSQEPDSRINEVLDKLLEETQERLKWSVPGKIRNLMLISAFQHINQYKISSYKTALTFAMELELENVTDLLLQVVDWERKTNKALMDIALKEFSKSGEAIRS
jgi:ferritin-like metal-binding protein YciE